MVLVLVLLLLLVVVQCLDAIGCALFAATALADTVSCFCVAVLICFCFGWTCSANVSPVYNRGEIRSSIDSKSDGHDATRRSSQVATEWNDPFFAASLAKSTFGTKTHVDSDGRARCQRQWYE